MSTQTTLPGRQTVVSTYECGYGRTHQIPSESIRILKDGGAGFVGYCDCGGHDVSTATEKPHRLGPHAVLLGGTNLSKELWLALEDIAEWGWIAPDSGTSHGGEPYATRREERREQYAAAVDGGNA
jgi:hypothetical protein